jgi:hypothetical protein
MGEHYRPAHETHLGSPSLFSCFFYLCRVAIQLRIYGFAKTLKSVRESNTKICYDGVEWSPLVARTAHNIAIAGALFPGRARCLEQSLALIAMLRRRGVRVEFKLGVQPYRFRAHAWVEYNGLPVNESGEVIDGLVSLPSI